MIRSFLFTLAYWVISIFYVLVAAISLALPGRRVVGWVVARYTRRMVQAMRWIAGIRLKVEGKDKVPDGACIIAAKHHSWFDGFCMYSQFHDVAFVTGDHLERLPLLGGILQKLGAIVVDNCGGHTARQALADSAALAHADGRKILIYPEGHLSKAGEHHRYRSGVWHMYQDFGLPVVPAATNLGVFAPQQGMRKHPGVTTLKFMDPIPVGLPKAEFMARLEETIERATDELIAQARGGPVVRSVLVADEASERVQAKAGEAAKEEA